MNIVLVIFDFMSYFYALTFKCLVQFCGSILGSTGIGLYDINEQSES